MREVEGVISRLGGRGDGVMDTAAGRLYVPFTLPGERVMARIGKPRGDGLAADLREILEPAPARIEPVCPHFHACGGCSLQHMAAADYAAWKRGQVIAALTRRDLPGAVVAPLWRPPAPDRRRAEFVARKAGGRVLLGFHERESNRIVDIAACPVLDDRLAAMIAPLRAALGGVLGPGEGGDLKATCCDQGIDLLVTSDAMRDRQSWIDAARALDLARLSWRRGADDEPETVIAFRAPTVTLSGIAVAAPADAFLQASPAAEAEMTRLVLDGLGPARDVADLFCGVGTFTLAIAPGRRRVIAADAAARSVAALRAAARGRGLKIEATARDLGRRPLAGADLAGIEAALFDPPRAGAREQAAALAASKVGRVVAVSCEASSFARDARLLVDAGFTLDAVTPIDQFPFTPHVELVAILRR